MPGVYGTGRQAHSLPPCSIDLLRRELVRTSSFQPLDRPHRVLRYNGGASAAVMHKDGHQVEWQVCRECQTGLTLDRLFNPMFTRLVTDPDPALRYIDARALITPYWGQGGGPLIVDPGGAFADVYQRAYTILRTPPPTHPRPRICRGAAGRSSTCQTRGRGVP
jgi:hypothetical protein